MGWDGDENGMGWDGDGMGWDDNGGSNILATGRRLELCSIQRLYYR